MRSALEIESVGLSALNTVEIDFVSSVQDLLFVWIAYRTYSCLSDGILKLTYPWRVCLRNKGKRADSSMLCPMIQFSLHILVC